MGKKHEQMLTEVTGKQKPTPQGAVQHQQMGGPTPQQKSGSAVAGKPMQPMAGTENATPTPMELPGNPRPCHGDGTPVSNG